MDNASKALTMVGAILIAVLLISLGVYIFNRAKNNVNVNLDRVDNVLSDDFEMEIPDTDFDY